MKAILLGSIGALADISALRRRAFSRAFQENGLNLADLRPDTGRRIPRRHRVSDDAIPLAKVLGDRTRFFREELEQAQLRRQPGLDALLDGVAAAGLAFGIVTTTPAAWLGLVLEDINLEADIFDTIVTADQVVAQKPQPDCYHLAAAMVAVAPEDCLAIEDSYFGAMAAERAGMAVHMLPVLPVDGENMAHLLRAAAEMGADQA